MEPGGGQALEEAEKIKQERGDDFEIWWQLGAQKCPKHVQYELPSDDMAMDQYLYIPFLGG